MALHSFCGILTLQVGVAIISVVFWVIATLTFVVNFFEFFGKSEFPTFALTISTFVVLLLLAGLIAFFSAYDESNSLCMTGVALISLITVVWVIISSLSFYNDQSMLGYVCINDRCPETFWLAPLKYRLIQVQGTSAGNADDSYDSLDNSTETSNTTNKVDKRSVDNYFNVPLDLDDFDENVLRKRRDENNVIPLIDKTGEIVSDKTRTQDVRTGYIFGIPLIGAVVLFICNFFLFLFSILVLWSYGQELVWTNSYLQDIPEYTPS